MEDGLFTNQGKKLLFVALFLVLVAMLVGGEDDPGMIAQISEKGAGNGSVEKPHYAQPLPVEPAATARAPRRVEQSSDGDLSLDEWYAEAGPVEPVSPEPVDESYLINDTKPAVSTDPGDGLVY